MGPKAALLVRTKGFSHSLGRKQRPCAASQPGELLCSAELHFQFGCYRTPSYSSHATWGRKAMMPSVRARTSGDARQVATAS